MKPPVCSVFYLFNYIEEALEWKGKAKQSRGVYCEIIFRVYPQRRLKRRWSRDLLL
ncbi:unnamed protein product [Nezara viridula]|uniref:Uncharacterized protein n=1 Tax=Nezara viridula TaxID=85310 RepID=A0A9P0H247_NEZVI|nr:unnamed protein product [Nezara viridula]